MKELHDLFFSKDILKNQIGYQSLTFSKDASSLFMRDVFQDRVGCKPLGFLVKSDTANVNRCLN